VDAGWKTENVERGHFAQRGGVSKKGVVMRRMRVLGTALLLVVFVMSVGSAYGQDVTASLTGTVTDQSGSAVGGAKVSAKDVLRGTSYAATTGSEGAFYINRIPVGTYDVRVEAQGFQTALQPGITLVLNQTARLEIQLKVGQTTQVVEVTSAPPVLQTDTVQVNTSGDPTSALLQNCAGSPGKYPDTSKFFLLTSSTQIVTTFAQIATELSNLRVAK